MARLDVVSVVLDENLLTGILYLLTGLAAVAVMISAGLHALTVRGRARAIARALCLVGGGVGVLSLWWAYSRFHDRPQWMAATDVAAVARLFLLMGLVALLRIYYPRHRWLQGLVVLAGGLVLILMFI